MDVSYIYLKKESLISLVFFLFDLTLLLQEMIGVKWWVFPLLFEHEEINGKIFRRKVTSYF